MVTEPEPGYLTLVDRLDGVLRWLRDVRETSNNERTMRKVGGHLTTLLDAIEALQCSSREFSRSAGSALEWLPIESAPKDGTLILACQRPDEGTCWFKTWEQWKAPQTIAWRGYHVNAPGKDTWRDGKGSPVMPDLWMPLDVLSVQP